MRFKVFLSTAAGEEPAMKQIILFGILLGMSIHPVIIASDLPPVAVQQVSSPGRIYFYSGETVTFSAAGSYDQDEDGYSITYYEWYVDGAYKAGGSSKRIWTTSFSVSSGQTTVHIKLRVRDDENNWSEQTTSYTVKAKPGRVYYLKDHLGSVRTSVDENGHVIGYDDYYPFGLTMPGRSSNSGNPNDNYKYTGHELDNEANLDLYYAGARYLDPVLGRWLSIDPLASKFPGWSPYTYALNNPINMWDPDGRAAKHCCLDYSARYVALNQDAVAKGKDPIQYIESYHSAQAVNTGKFAAGVLAAVSPVDETTAVGWLASKIPGGSKTLSIAGKYADEAWGAVKGLFRSGDEVVSFSKAYSEAANGGKHAGFLDNFAGRSTSELDKTINSLQYGKRGISVHEDKIANPSKYVENFDDLTPQHQQNLIDGWRKEIQNAREQIDILKDIKKQR